MHKSIDILLAILRFVWFRLQVHLVIVVRVYCTLSCEFPSQCRSVCLMHKFMECDYVLAYAFDMSSNLLPFTRLLFNKFLCMDLRLTRMMENLFLKHPIHCTGQCVKGPPSARAQLSHARSAVQSRANSMVRWFDVRSLQQTLNLSVTRCIARPIAQLLERLIAR